MVHARADAKIRKGQAGLVLKSSGASFPQQRNATREELPYSLQRDNDKMRQKRNASPFLKAYTVLAPTRLKQ